MRGLVRSFMVLSLVGCSGSAPPAKPEAPPAPAPPAPAPPAPAPAPPPAPAPAGVAPTALSDAQKHADAANAPLAQSILDAYPNLTSIFSSLVASWSPDGSRIVFGSLRDGAPEIYAGDPAKPGDPAVAISRGPERATWARYTLDGKAILFLRDANADENYHIWRVNPDGSGLTDLTPGETWHREEPFLPRQRPDVMIYTAAKVTDPSTVVFEQPLGGGPARQAFINPGPGGLTDVAADGKHALFVDFHSNDDVVLFELELASSTVRRIYPAANKKVAIDSAIYSPDGARIYVTTDEGAESSVALALDTKSGKQLARHVSTGPRGAPLNAVISPAGDRLVVRADAGNHDELRVLDARTLAQVRAIKLPLGAINLGTFRPDGKQFSISISVPDHPADLYAVELATGALHPLHDEPRAGLAALPRLSSAIVGVQAFDGLNIPLNVYLPAADANPASKAPPARRPTLVMFHGGPASSYKVRWSPFVRFFVALGYAVVEPNVRGSAGFGRAYEMADNREKRADWLKDLETVNAWTKRQAWCDPDRVVVWGGSYGGYTTLMALTRQPALWRAGVDLFGIADLKKFLQTTDAAIRSIFITEFGDLDKDGELLDRFSPMRDVDKITRPLFVYAGQHDPRVPRSESDAIVRALRERNVPVEYMVAATEGHSIDHRDNQLELLTRTARFLAAALAGPAPTAAPATK